MGDIVTNAQRANDIVETWIAGCGVKDAKARVVKALDDAEARGVPAQVRPIATAPKDGTPILLWYEGSKYDARGWKVGRLEQWTVGWVPVVGSTVYSTTADAFTHWCPLPAAPPTEAERETAFILGSF